MAPRTREISEASAFSHDTELSSDARVARAAEELLAGIPSEDDGDNEISESDDDDQDEEGEGEDDDDSEDEDGDDEDEDGDDEDDEDDEDDDDDDDEDDDDNDDDEEGDNSHAPLPNEVLRHTLSVNSVVSTSSSFAQRMENAKILQGDEVTVIGRGTCGTVFEIPGTETALKVGSDKAALWNDINLTNIACQAVMHAESQLEKKFPDISIPKVPMVKGWIEEDELEKWWDTNRKRFPAEDASGGYLFLVQRILPLPKPTRTALIQLYFPRKHRRAAMKNSYNNACLARPYLGMRRGDREITEVPDTLANFPLYLDQLEDIGIDIAQFANEMAVGLAIIHWRAELDGMDMEFVIGSATVSTDLPVIVPHFDKIKPFSVPWGDFKRRQTHLWMLDFDKAAQLDFQKPWKVIRETLVTAVTANDPYFPDPSGSDSDADTWKIFKKAYIGTAQMFARTKSQPVDFIKAWEKKAKELNATKDGSFIVFGE